MSYNIQRDISFGKNDSKYFLTASNSENHYGDYKLEQYNVMRGEFYSMYFNFSFGKDGIKKIAFNIGGLGDYDGSKVFGALKKYGASISPLFKYDLYTMKLRHFQDQIIVENPSDACKTFVSDLYHVWMQNDSNDWKEPMAFIKENLDTENGLNSQDEIKQNISQFSHSTLFRFKNVNNNDKNKIMSEIESYVYSPELKPQ